MSKSGAPAVSSNQHDDKSVPEDPDCQVRPPSLKKVLIVRMKLPRDAPSGSNDVTSTTNTNNDSDSDAAIIHNLKRKLTEDLPDELKAGQKMVSTRAVRAKLRRQRKRWPSTSDESYDEIADTEFDLKIDEIYRDLANRDLANTSDENSEDEGKDTSHGDKPEGANGQETEVSKGANADPK